MISCSWGYDNEDAIYFDIDAADFSQAEEPIKCGACSKEVRRCQIFWTMPRYQIDEGYEMALPAMEYCEVCGDMFLNLINLEFCFDYESDPVEQWREYRKDYL